MPRFKIGDQVIHAAYGLGRIVNMQTKQLFAGEAQLYYEVVTAKNTVWVPVDSATATTLRPITGKADLAHFSQVLRAKPMPMSEDRRQRQISLNERLKPGSFGVMCEVVRDLTALSWRKPLRDADAELLRRVHDTLSQEWAVAADLSPYAADQQIDALIGESKQAYLAQ
jgi:RNA polymerase-interacting CarD/CdnL/TRCF family regulator